MFKFQYQNEKKRKNKKKFSKLQNVAIRDCKQITNRAKRSQIGAGISNRGNEISNRGKRDFKSGQGLQIGAEQKYYTIRLLKSVISFKVLYFFYIIKHAIKHLIIKPFDLLNIRSKTLVNNLSMNKF